ncbi:RNA polymerase sigma factor [Aliiroseovarius sp. YM-037]|uniref:RNA polymerase sigma factor n=1 Tax=Aliiroseovarius sp. YM-037 TaxID=3341728 RepID=UPI003A7F866C
MTQDWLSARFADIRPRAIAALTRQFRDIDLAEETFAEACLKAVERWSKPGPPDDPLAWLLFVARNAGIDRLRKVKRQDALPVDDAPCDMPEDDLIAMIDQNGLRDDVLRLLFVCCHPALTRQDQLALALKVVAGLSVAEIAHAFLVKPKTMEQRLTRAKKTIAANPVSFDPPQLEERHHRLREVSLMIYLMFNEGWSASTGAEQIKLTLCDEAVRLARLLLTLYPGMSEQMGLLALLLYQHARHAARVDDDGALVALDQQDRGLWNRDMIAEAQHLVTKARRHGVAGPYLLQAEIAEVHALAASDEATDWARLGVLYATLYRVQPTPVVRLNQAVAVGKAQGPAAALAMLDEVADDLATYRWLHTTRAAFLAELGQTYAAIAALEAARTLDPTAPELQALDAKIATLRKI